MHVSKGIGINVVFLCVVFIGASEASIGDRSQFFVNCVRGCKFKNCTEGKLHERYSYVIYFLH